MKKKILFIIPGLEHGGTNKALENILLKVSQQEYDISIYCLKYNIQSPYYKIFKTKLIENKGIRLNLLNKYGNLQGYTKLVIFLVSIFRRASKWIYWDFENILCKNIAQSLSSMKFDIAIAFQETTPTKLGSHIIADKKIAWIHCNYERINKQNRTDKAYQEFNKIICVSNYTKNVFCNIVPCCRQKAETIYNIIDDENIINLSQQPIDDYTFDENIFYIVSVGRIDPVKRFTEIPSIAAELYYQKKMSSIKWIIIGNYNSNEGEILRKNIKKYNIEHIIDLLGPKQNPYKYMAKCQLYVCLSISEACPFVINESKILHIPVITTDYPSAYEFIKDHCNGRICKLNEIPQNIEKIIKEKEYYNSIIDNIAKYRYDNKLIVSQLSILFS